MDVQETVTVNEIASVAVAFGHSELGPHTGILVRETDGLINFYHMPLVRAPIQRSVLPKHFLWRAPSIPVERSDLVAALCRLIAARYREVGIPYSFKYTPDMVFNLSSGQFQKGTGSGLTCATFVLAIFQSLGTQIVHYLDWPPRPDDHKWQEKMAKWLEKQGALKKEVEAARAEIPSLRYRPDEVCAACGITPLPAKFAETRQAADLLVAEYEAKRKV
jgi:hypothetical protein